MANGDQTVLTQGTGYIEYVVKDFFAAGEPGADANFLAFAWGMSCANDIILGAILDPGQITWRATARRTDSSAKRASRRRLVRSISGEACISSE